MTGKTFEAIEAKQVEQRARWGLENHNPFYWIAILSEECGKLSQALLKSNGDLAKDKLVSVAAVCCSWLDMWL
jgi:hypothetical protein